MKGFLLYRDRDLDLERRPGTHDAALIQDLELATLFHAMAQGDPFLFDVASKTILSSLDCNVDTILYRQAILRDCLDHPDVVRAIYDLTVEAIQQEKKVFFGIFGRHPDTILHRSTELLSMLTDILSRLRSLVDQHAGEFQSEGFRTLFAMLQRELSDDFFAAVQDHLRELKFRKGVLISVQLGKGNKGTDFVLRRHPNKQGWRERIFGPRPTEYTLTIDDADEAGAKALTELRERGINLVANALAQSTDHILAFLFMLRAELGFYIGCLNLHGQLMALGEPVCFPEPAPSAQGKHTFRELYDVCLALTMQQKVVGNDLNADGKSLVIITGANQGGKSTFLRSVGLAQLMMQAGMVVPAEAFSSSVCDGLFTHYRREEDATMTSGKLDEELSRMSAVVDTITRYPMLLFNESFAATNDREGSEIARQIVSALLERSNRIFFVTHLYHFAHSFYEKRLNVALFLRAERQENGARTFKLFEGEPLQTSFGVDLYQRVFGANGQG